MGYVAQATNKRTGYFETCTKVDSLKEAYHYSRYYRSIGYNAKVYSDEEYEKVLEEEYKRRKQQNLIMMIY